MTLTRFPRKQTEELVRRVAGDKALPGEALQQIVAKTDGVPLFVEELTKMVLESGLLLRDRDDHYELTGPLPPLAIPSTLQDSLMARLDRLATVKGVAQLGATLGRAFPYELLRAVSPLDDVTLQQELGRFPLWVAWASVLRGLALAKQGQHELGIAQLKQALLTLRAAGSEFQVPFVLSWLAEACACAGQAEAVAVGGQARADGGHPPVAEPHVHDAREPRPGVENVSTLEKNSGRGFHEARL